MRIRKTIEPIKPIKPIKLDFNNWIKVHKNKEETLEIVTFLANWQNLTLTLCTPFTCEPIKPIKPIK